MPSQTSPGCRLSLILGGGAVAILALAWCGQAQQPEPKLPLRPKVPAVAPTPLLPADLAKAAETARAEVAELFRELAKSVDRLELAGGETIEIEPLRADSLLDPQFTGTIEARESPSGEIKKLERAQVAGFQPYERRALKMVADFDKSSADLPVLDKVTAMETAISAVLRFHLALRDRPLQGVNLWSPLQEDLETRLRELRGRWLRAEALVAHDESQWIGVLARAVQLTSAYPGNLEILTDVARLRTRYAAFLLFQTEPKIPLTIRYAGVRRELEWIDDNLAAPPLLDPADAVAEALASAGFMVPLPYKIDANTLKEYLQSQARALQTSAAKTPDAAQAVRKLEEALRIWPHLPSLREQYLRRQGKYTVLRVGVRQLPRFLSPNLAQNDAEKQALELLFEGLVQARPGAEDGLTYAPQIATSISGSAGGLRRFQLHPEARWSNGGRLAPADVQKSFELLTSLKLPGHTSEFTDQLDAVRASDSSPAVEVQYKKPLLDPLAPLAFKVLPRELVRQADDEAFALNPVGSGPYVFAGPRKEDGRDYVVFAMNPYYYERAGQPLPAIHEVRMFVSGNPAADFASKTAPMHLCLDVPAARLAAIKSSGAAELRKLESRRVWFLALNHRDRGLADQSLRRALAHGIQREGLLAECFGVRRSGVLPAASATGPGAAGIAIALSVIPHGPKHHHALNGPFPAGSWPNCTDVRVPERLHNRTAAESFLRTAKFNNLELELKYPNDDPAVAHACKMMADQFQALGNLAGKSLRIKLVALPPQQLRRDLLEHRYQLAYTHYDYPNDLFSLWPLFDPQKDLEAPGSNFLGYDDADLTEKLHKVASSRDFAEVKRQMQNIHADLFEHMPLIPLWQLDYQIAVHPDLSLGRVEAQRIFSTIADWKLRTR